MQKEKSGKKTKKDVQLALILVGAAVLIGALVWWYYSRVGQPSAGAPTPNPAGQAGEITDYYEGFRARREETRTQEAAYLGELSGDERVDVAVRRDAERAKLELAQNMEHELVIEQLLLAKGYADAAVTVSAGGVNVVVKTQDLTPAQTAVILEAVTRQTGISSSSVFIVTSP